MKIQSAFWKVCLVSLVLVGSGYAAESIRVLSPDHKLVAGQITNPERLAIYKIIRGKEQFTGIFDLDGKEIVRMKWSPDSKFLILTTRYTQGHSPWHYPAYAYCLSDNTLRSIDKDTDLGDVTDPFFSFTGHHKVVFKVIDPKVGWANMEPRVSEWKTGTWVKKSQVTPSEPSQN